MTKNKELKKLGDQIDELEDGEIKKQLSINYRNILHNNGELPCDGIWNAAMGQCEEFDETSIPPKVSAGRNRTVDVGESVTLAGEIKDFKNYLVYKGWNQVTHPSVPLVQQEGSADGSTLTIHPIKEGEYTYQFTATDVKGQSGSDTIVVTVKSKESRKAEKEAKEKKESEEKEQQIIKENAEEKKTEVKEEKKEIKPEEKPLKSEEKLKEIKPDKTEEKSFTPNLFIKKEEKSQPKEFNRGK
jgi:hypothetical protein